MTDEYDRTATRNLEIALVRLREDWQDAGHMTPIASFERRCMCRHTPGQGWWCP
jgi:hypothetical protein